MSTVTSVNARTGESSPVEAAETTPDELDALASDAHSALTFLDEIGRGGRQELLEAIAKEMESNSEAIIATADAESALGTTRLTGELARTCFQLRFMGQVAADGAYLDAVIDHAGKNPAGPRPDVRKINQPLGVVGVFGASNFPLAFSVAGGDTASALAAGCPVIAKAHPAHPKTSLLVARAIEKAIAGFGGPTGTFSLVFGREAGTSLVKQPLVSAVGFTGSEAGGRALADIAAARPRPIPFYGELGSVNPLVVTRSAAETRARDVGADLAGSVMMGVGQFCTKPGLILVPAGSGTAELKSAFVAAVESTEPGAMLTDQIRDVFVDSLHEIEAAAGRTLVNGSEADRRTVGGVAVSADIDTLRSEAGAVLLDEHFGPFAVFVEYRDDAELQQTLDLLPDALTGTVQSSGAEDPDLPHVIALLQKRSGRVIVDGYPTGVSVTWAMNHGGTYPAATSPRDTSVGAASIDRWVRPVSFQNVPRHLLPDELTDAGVPGLLRRVDGVMEISPA